MGREALVIEVEHLAQLVGRLEVVVAADVAHAEAEAGLEGRHLREREVPDADAERDVGGPAVGANPQGAAVDAGGLVGRDVEGEPQRVVAAGLQGAAALEGRQRVGPPAPHARAIGRTHDLDVLDAVQAVLWRLEQVVPRVEAVHEIDADVAEIAARPQDDLDGLVFVARGGQFDHVASFGRSGSRAGNLVGALTPPDIDSPLVREQIAIARVVEHGDVAGRRGAVDLVAAPLDAQDNGVLAGTAELARHGGRCDAPWRHGRIDARALLLAVLGRHDNADVELGELAGAIRDLDEAGLRALGLGGGQRQDGDGEVGAGNSDVGIGGGAVEVAHVGIEGGRVAVLVDLEVPRLRIQRVLLLARAAQADEDGLGGEEVRGHPGLGGRGRIEAADARPRLAIDAGLDGALAADVVLRGDLDARGGLLAPGDGVAVDDLSTVEEAPAARVEPAAEALERPRVVRPLAAERRPERVLPAADPLALAEDDVAETLVDGLGGLELHVVEGHRRGDVPLAEAQVVVVRDLGGRDEQEAVALPFSRGLEVAVAERRPRDHAAAGRVVGLRPEAQAIEGARLQAQAGRSPEARVLPRPRDARAALACLPRRPRPRPFEPPAVRRIPARLERRVGQRPTDRLGHAACEEPQCQERRSHGLASNGSRPVRSRRPVYARGASRSKPARNTNQPRPGIGRKGRQDGLGPKAARQAWSPTGLGAV